MSDKSRYLKFFLLIKEKVDKLSSEIYLRPVFPMNPGSVMAGYITKENHLFVFHWLTDEILHFWKMYLKALHWETNLSFPWLAHLHIDKCRHIHKDQNLIPAGQKQKSEVQQFSQVFQARIPLLKNKQNVNRKTGES